MSESNADPQIWVDIVQEPINVSALQAKLHHLDSGAQGLFVGVTRRTTGKRLTETLAYEAHEPMARRQLEKLATAALRRFSLRAVAIVHRLGEVPLGEASVVVGCSSAHRPETFAALPWIMDELKRDVPIWKKEHYADGSTEWVHPTQQRATS